MTLYEKIDFLCKSQNITRKELARQTGISYATLNSMFARQSTNISLETIRAIANHFNVSLDYLLADEIDRSMQNSEASPSTKILSELYEVAKDLSEDEQLYLLDTVKALKQRLNRE